MDAIRHAREYQIAWMQSHPEEAETMHWENYRQGIIERYERKIRAYTSYGVPRKFAQMALDGTNIQNQPLRHLPVMDRLLDALTAGKKIIIVLGVVGAGKTLGVIRTMFQNGYPSEYISASDICQYNPNFAHDRYYIEKFTHYSRLIVDEIGIEIAERDSAKLEILLHKRIEFSRLTVCIGNMSKNVFLDKFGDRITRRVIDEGIAIECLTPISEGGKKLLKVKK